MVSSRRASLRPYRSRRKPSPTMAAQFRGPDESEFRQAKIQKYSCTSNGVLRLSSMKMYDLLRRMRCERSRCRRRPSRPRSPNADGNEQRHFGTADEERRVVRDERPVERARLSSQRIFVFYSGERGSYSLYSPLRASFVIGFSYKDLSGIAKQSRDPSKVLLQYGMLLIAAVGAYRNEDWVCLYERVCTCLRHATMEDLDAIEAVEAALLPHLRRPQATKALPHAWPLIRPISAVGQH